MYHYEMGILRKAISGSAAFMTSGASLGLIQFRSDTERNTRQLKKLTEEIAKSGSSGGLVSAMPGIAAVDTPAVSLNLTTHAATDAVALTSGSGDAPPDDLTPGWKAVSGQGDRFWNGHQWTKLTR